MNFLDWCLVVLALAYALSGYWQGFITGACATAGLINKLFDHVGLTRPWDATVQQELPDYMFGLSQD